MLEKNTNDRVYDIFVHFDPADEAWVREHLLPRLQQEKFYLVVWGEHANAGESRLNNLERAVKQSYKTIIVLTQQWVDSKWGQYILDIVAASDPTGRLHGRLLPIRLKRCELPTNVYIRDYADATDSEGWQTELHRLVKQLWKQLPPRERIEDEHNAITQTDQTGKDNSNTNSNSEAKAQNPPIIDTGRPGNNQSAAAEKRQFRVGDVIKERFEVREDLGSGGFATTYLVYDMEIKRMCVFKQLKTDPSYSIEEQQRIARMLKHEVEILGNLGSSTARIPEIYDFLPEYNCFVMQYINGKNLRKMLHDRGNSPLPLPKALHYTRAVCEILHHLHNRSERVLHGDIKLDNIMCDLNNDIWLIDFGLGQHHTAASSGKERAFEVGGGTPGYTPPEQWQGVSQPQSDIYALTRVLYQLATGDQHTSAAFEELKPIPKHHSIITQEIKQLIIAGLSINPAQRPNAETFLRRLNTIIAKLLCAPDGTVIADKRELVRWCESHWVDEQEEHSAVSWLATSMANDIERAWKHSSEGAIVHTIGAAMEWLSYIPDYDERLDQMLAVIEPEGFGKAQPVNPVSANLLLDFGSFSREQVAERTFELRNHGKRYMIAQIMRPGWIKTPTATVGLRPGETKSVTLLAQGCDLPHRRTIKERLEIHYGVSKPVYIPVQASLSARLRR